MCDLLLCLMTFHELNRLEWSSVQIILSYDLRNAYFVILFIDVLSTV
jgi:hypothetical protein